MLRDLLIGGICGSLREFDFLKSQLYSAATGAPVANELSGGLGNGRFGVGKLSLSVNYCTWLQDRSLGRSFAEPASLFCQCCLCVSGLKLLLESTMQRSENNNFHRRDPIPLTVALVE